MIRRTLALALVLALAACSGSSEPAPTVAPEPPIAAAPSTPSAPAPTEAPSAPEVPQVMPPDRTYSVLTLPAEVALETIPVRRVDRTLTGDEFIWGEVHVRSETAQHPDPGIRSAIDAWVRAKVDQHLGDGAPVEEIDCRLRLATPTAVALVCHVLNAGDRGESYYTVSVTMARIQDNTLVPFDMTDALVPRTGIRELLRERCERQYRRREAEGEYASDPCSGQQNPPLVPTNEGLRAVYTGDYEASRIEVSVEWGDLGDLVRADGPLAAIVPHTGTHEVAVTGVEQLEARLSLSCHAGFYVSRARPLGETIALARRAGRPETGDSLSVRREGDASRLVLQRCVHGADEMGPLAARAATLAGEIGERAAALEGEGTLPIQWMRVDRSLALRDRGAREGAWRATLPAGLIVPVLLGDLDGASSGVGYQGTWARVFPTDAREGWSAGRYLRRSLVVPPSAAAMVANVPEAHRTAAARDVMIGDLAPVGAPAPLWFVAASTPEPAVYVGVSESGPGGAVAPPLSRAAGELDELEMIRQPEDAPRAYALVGTRIVGAAAGMVRWQLFAPGAAEPGWTLDAPTGASVPSSARASYETRVTRDRQTWLVDFTLPDRTHVRVRDEGGRFVTE